MYLSIISDNGSSQIIDLNELIEEQDVSSIKLKPHDTIHIDETFTSYVLSRSNVLNILLQITNLVLITSNQK